MVSYFSLQHGIRAITPLATVTIIGCCNRHSWHVISSHSSAISSHSTAISSISSSLTVAMVERCLRQPIISSSLYRQSMALFMNFVSSLPSTTLSANTCHHPSKHLKPTLE